MNSKSIIVFIVVLMALSMTEAKPQLFGGGLTYGSSSGGYQQSSGYQQAGGYQSGYGGLGGLGYGGLGGPFGGGYSSGYQQGSGYQQASGGYQNQNIGLGFGIGRR